MRIHPIFKFIIVSILLLNAKAYSKSFKTTTNPFPGVTKDSISVLSNREKQVLRDTLDNFEESINLNTRVDAEKFWDYPTQRAWLDYRLFESNLKKDYDANQFLAQTKAYLKDSTQILIVKLKGLQTLDEKGLLVKDIIQNEEYYLSLLKEFEGSELPPRTYIYFENKIRKVCLEVANNKYQTSLILNLAGLITIGGLTFGYFRTKQVKPSSAVLSVQEKRINHLIIEGKTNKEIATELFISVSTVKTHTSNIYSKLGVKNRKELQGKA